MRIFISWSGDRSRRVASVLKDFLPLVLHFAEPWMSETDIESGARGMDKIAQELEQRNYGIVCVTSENLRAPWLNFEAGALSKSVEEGRVVPLLLGLDAKDVPPPLGQFQAKRIDRDGMLALVADVNRAWRTPVDERNYSRVFAGLWPEFEEKFRLIGEAKEPQASARKDGEILEELVVGVRSLELALRDGRDQTDSGGLPKTGISDLANAKIAKQVFASLQKSNAIGHYTKLLLASGLLKNDFPWLAEVLLECHRQMFSDRVEVRKSGSALLSGLATYFNTPENMTMLMTVSSRELKRSLHEVVAIVNECHEWNELIG